MKKFEVCRVKGKGGLWLSLPTNYCRRNDVREGDILELEEIPSSSKLTTFDHLTRKEMEDLFYAGDVPFRNMKGIKRLGH